ncbi:immunoglobulin domain-containing protein [Gelatiniphilus marinus]|uniref:Immunoglobulin domain-containing protein n=1 Tax=Gelatiniphilus marinus TaxID=1759464 RepID=A0ABW5JVD5_9FLAO
MKLLKKTVLLSFVLVLFVSGSCSDDEEFRPTLPPITQTGSNTFGCYIDGKLLTPRDGAGTLHTQDKGVRMIAGGIPREITYWELKVRDFKSGNGGLLTFHIQNLHQNKKGVYVINEGNCEVGVDALENVNITCRWLDKETQNYKWYCSIENGGTLTITRYDFENRIVSGTFSCTVQNRDDATDTVEITEGRFDLKWDTLPYTNFH